MDTLEITPEISWLIDRALAEDVGIGDPTSMATLSSDAKGSARLLIKEDGVLAGIPIALEVFKRIDEHLEVVVKIEDGSQVKVGDVVFVVTGHPGSILTAERTVLNFMQRLSGVATSTHKVVEALEGTNTEVLDTRKTTPGWRVLEKWAVKIGGGENHRMGLYDMIMIKDNHIDFCGSISAAIDKVQNYLKAQNLGLEIEVETRNIQEIKEVLRFEGIKRVMLDNFNTKDLTEAVQYINGAVETEASGGITLKNVKAYADTGVDFISMGALTHSVKGLDMSLKVLKLA